MLIKNLYTLFLAILIALFVGLGIDSFYIKPVYPMNNYPAKVEMTPENNKEQTKEQELIQKEFEISQEKYMKELKNYNKNVSIVALIIAIVVLVISLTFTAKIKFIADGILLGGVFIVAYSIICGFESDYSQFRFFMVTIGLIIALALGYIKFVKPQKD